MARGKIMAICQSGGEFATNSDGTMSYSGGEAHAIEIEREMLLCDLKSEFSNMFSCKSDAILIKYFLPHNRRTLITVSSDKDLQRMVDFHADSTTTDIYVVKKVENSIVADSGTPIATTERLYALVEAKRQKLCIDWDNVITGVGQVFDNARAFRDALHKYAIANSFVYRFVKNDTMRITAECTSEDCPWRIHASKSSSNQEFEIKKMIDNHTCDRDISKEGHLLASQRWIASVIKNKLRDSPDYKPKEIVDDVHREYGLSLNYSQAWRGKLFAKQELHNPHEEACNQLPWFCKRILETNPGSVASLVTEEDSKFRLFVAFHASLSGFEHGCCPLLFLDAVSLKANKQWKVLVASTADGEDEIFPVAFSVVDADTNDNWHWFLLQLKSALSMSCTLTFVSNWKNGLLEEVPRVFEDSHHGYCVHDLIEDFKLEFDDSWTQEIKDSLVDYLQRAVHACKEEEFNECIEAIKTKSEELAEWVLATKPERWSDAFFKGLRHGHYSSEAKQTVNNWVLARHEPSVVEMVDMIRCKMMEMIYTRRESSNTWVQTLTPSMSRKLEEEMNKARTLGVVCLAGSEFEVRDESVNVVKVEVDVVKVEVNVVKVETWECSCRRWQVTGLPCVHALAVFERTNVCVYDYCSKYFTTECYRLTYLLSINPIPDVGRQVSSDPADGIVMCPRRTRRLAGRPKVKPVDLRITVKKGVRCSKCKLYGHNKQSCKASNV